MWTYSAVNFLVTIAVFGSGVLGFALGWLAHRAAVRERAEAHGSHDPYNV